VTEREIQKSSRR